MPKTPTGAKRPADVIGNAVHVMRIATGEVVEKPTPKSAAAEMGAKGGKARAAAFSKKKRSAIAKATGLSREQLYKTLSAEGKPELATVLKVMAAFGGGLRSSFQAPKRRQTKARKAA